MMNVMAVINDKILNPLIVLLFAVAVVIFAWGAFGVIRSDLDSVGYKESRRHMVWGVIGVFIMVSVGGFLNFITSILGGFVKPH